VKIKLYDRNEERGLFCAQWDRIEDILSKERVLGAHTVVVEHETEHELIALAEGVGFKRIRFGTDTHADLVVVAAKADWPHADYGVKTLLVTPDGETHRLDTKR